MNSLHHFSASQEPGVPAIPMPPKRTSLSRPAYRLWKYLEALHRIGGWVAPSTRHLQEHFKCSTPTIRRWFGELYRRGIIRSRRRGPHPPAYQVLISSNGYGRNFRKERQLDQVDIDRKDRKWLAAMPYKAFLKTAHWSDVKLLIWTRYGNKCAKCLRESLPTEVHHLTYKHRGYEDKHLDDLILLCVDCHEAAHQDSPVAERVAS